MNDVTWILVWSCWTMSHFKVVNSRNSKQPEQTNPGLTTWKCIDHHRSAFCLQSHAKEEASNDCQLPQLVPQRVDWFSASVVSVSPVRGSHGAWSEDGIQRIEGIGTFKTLFGDHEDLYYTWDMNIQGNIWTYYEILCSPGWGTDRVLTHIKFLISGADLYI